MDRRDDTEHTRRLDAREEAGRLERMADQARESLGRAKDGLAAGASGLMERTADVAGAARERTGRAVDFVREAEPDTRLKQNVAGTTEHSLSRAGDALIDAAPTIGRNAERAAEKVGQALNTIARPLAAVLGTIAGTLGGWWKKAATESFEMPASEEEACRAHFATLAVVPGDLTYDHARTGYALGYLASRNPEYRDRRFEDVEPELRRGFGDADAADYDALREFTRYGYGRGVGRAG